MGGQRRPAAIEAARGKCTAGHGESGDVRAARLPPPAKCRPRCGDLVLGCCGAIGVEVCGDW